MMKEYIEREAAIREIERAMVSVLNDMPVRQFTKEIYEMAHRHCANVLARLPAADVVPWEWLERYAHGQRMNFASDFVAEARKRYEEGIH